MPMFLTLAATSGGATSSTAGGSSAGGVGSFVMELVLIGGILVLFYFMLIRPQKKREKETTKMRSALQVGDEVTTMGGVVGRVVSIKDDDSVIIESGADRNKLRFKKWAIQSCETIHDESK